MVRRMPSRKVLTFFLEGLMSSFPLGYLRTFCPRKSKPCSTCVMTVFFGESSRPRSCRKCSSRGLISPSSNSFDLLVMTKSSAYRTRLTHGFSPPRDLRRFPAGYFSRKSRSRPSSAQLASAGEVLADTSSPRGSDATLASVGTLSEGFERSVASPLQPRRLRANGTHGLIDFLLVRQSFQQLSG